MEKSLTCSFLISCSKNIFSHVGQWVDKSVCTATSEGLSAQFWILVLKLFSWQKQFTPSDRGGVLDHVFSCFIPFLLSEKQKVAMEKLRAQLLSLVALFGCFCPSKQVGCKLHLLQVIVHNKAGSPP